MNKNLSVYYWINLFLTACLLAFALAGCGDDGAQGAAGTPGPGVASKSTATAITITITGTTINASGQPVVAFSVVNEDNIPVAGMSDTNLRFNIAKLIPGSPAKWQNYINRKVTKSGEPTAVQGTQERCSLSNGVCSSSYAWGTLVDNINGTYTYTFATDIRSVACPAAPDPCTDVDGNALDLSYQAGITHRVTIQLSGLTPLYNAIYDFVPSGAAVTSTRDIVSTAKCNECHNVIRAHGSRIETGFCVTCHNPGSWDNTADNHQTVDFPVMIHKIHHGDELPSVNDATNPTPYMIGSDDFSDVAFPQDIRNCTKCHDGTPGASNATVNGDNWKNAPTKAACGACHDDLYFGDTPDPAKLYQTVRHMTLITDAGGTAIANPADSTCISCHATGQLAGSVVETHDLPQLLRDEAEKYAFNILSVCGIDVGSSPVCDPTGTGTGLVPTVRFSVTDPTNGNAAYDIKNDAAFKCVPGVGNGLPASLSVLIGWNNTDENNTGSGSNPGQPLTASVLESYSSSTGVCSANNNVVAVGDGSFTATLTGKVIPDGTQGSGRASVYGRVSAVIHSVTERVRIKAAYRDFRITDATAVARRTVVDVNKCLNCHDQLSLHGDSRTDEPGLCVICHNPSATDVNRRPKTGGIPDASGPDGKTEESIDFKRMIHGIHGAGFRENGLVVYGYSSTPIDFSGIRFPGILNDCLTCHVTPTGSNAGSYELADKWEVPTASGILSSTVSAVPTATDAGTYTTFIARQDDDLNITPTAAVCSSCHDGLVAKSHMILNGALFEETQADIASSGTLEACAICHGPGRTADVKSVHGVD
ncbi:MAG: OmcA/MtrC family decaheme c-type cytochrome [Gammaproteobacteria bacterium]|nr:OmcA/MtrC family decaheme c-type cytochrome [Gammaproteobacteria bacterium]